MQQLRKYEHQARELLKEGVDEVANAVKVTLGVKGRNVILDNPYTKTRVTKDGVTVARSIHVNDAMTNVGAKMVQDVAQKTADIAGDGTTTATVLAQAIIHGGLKLIAGGVNPMALKRGMDKAVEHIVKNLQEKSIQVPFDDKSIESVATISANNDPELGKLIAKLVSDIGKDWRIAVEISKTPYTTSTISEGYSINKGQQNPWFYPPGTKRDVIELEEPYIMLLDKKVQDFKSFTNILEQVIIAGRKPILIIAEDVNGGALAGLIQNNIKGIVKGIPIFPPQFGPKRTDMMMDLAVLTGGTYITDSSGVTLDNITLAHLGKAEKVVITKDSTMIIGPLGDQEALKTHVDKLREVDDEWSKERIAMMLGGIGIISVGAITDIEAQEKKYRVEDAVCATRAAIEEGILPGGGVALVRAKMGLKDLEADEEERSGIRLIEKAVEAPLIQMCMNGGDDWATILSEVKNSQRDSWGFNGKTGKMEDLLEAGVVDSTKVTRVGLQNAASVTSMIMISECMVVDIEEQQDQQ